MGFMDEFLIHTLTYWGAPVQKGFGNLSFASPIAITGLWQEKQELIRDPEGKEVMSKVKAFVDQDVVLLGYLYKGTSTAADPTTIPGAWPILRYKKMSDVDGEDFERAAWL